MRSTKAIINISNLKYNYLNIRKKVKGAKVLAVVKADAYGHGVKESVVALNSLDKKPEYFGVALMDEGIEVKKIGIKQPILIFEPLSRENIDEIIKYGLIPTVFNSEHIKLLKKYSDRRIKVHIKVDTGMGRLGCKFEDAFNFIKRVDSYGFIEIDGVYTHFATSDSSDKRFAKNQLEKFTDLINNLKKNKIKFGLAHCANSGAILDMSDSYFDMVRPGISLYGYYPSLETSESIDLKPVMSIVSKIDSVKRFRAGESISYGRLFYTKKETTIITVPIGYADGYNRNLTNSAYGIIKGKFYQQVGRVTMDRIMFDIGDNKIKVGESIILLGKQKDLKIDAWDWSKVLNTIPYEITCNISKRVPRIYKNK